MQDFVGKTVKFNLIADNEEKYDSRKLCLYIGLILEECEELLTAFVNDRPETDLVGFAKIVESFADDFKAGKYDLLADGSDDVEITDAACDIAVVSVGAIMSNGYHAQGALNEVADSNLSKYVDKGNGRYDVIKDENGKIRKADSYWRPELEKFAIRPSWYEWTYTVD